MRNDSKTVREVGDVVRKRFGEAKKQAECHTQLRLAWAIGSAADRPGQPLVVAVTSMSPCPA
jgi:hypothetical protein